MSELRANTISDAAGTGPVELTGQVASKSWVNFDGTGTVSIRESFNVSSITDGGTGTYTVNFATALTDANYSAITDTKHTTGSATQYRSLVEPDLGGTGAGFTTSLVNVITLAGGSRSDRNYVAVAVFR